MNSWRYKMDQKGVAAAAVVVVVIIIAVVGVGAFILLRGGGALGALPKYPGAQPVEGVTEADIKQVMTSYGLPATWSGMIYTTSASPENVINWYRTNMPGWEKFSDNTVQVEYGGALVTVYVLGYTKGNDGAIIETFDYAGYHILMLMAGPRVS